MIVFDKLNKRFGSLSAVTDLDLEVKPGELGGAAMPATAPVDVAPRTRALGLLALAIFGTGGVVARVILAGNLIDAGEPARGR